MTLEQDKAKIAFADVTRNGPEEASHHVPEMIRDDRPAPRPAPPQLGFDVDQEIFDAKWRAEQARARPTLTGGKLRNGFNQETDALARATEEVRQAQDRLDRLRGNARARDGTFHFQKTGEPGKDKFERIDDRARNRSRGRTRER